MCRALLYLGEPVLLDNLLYQPDSALVRQSYMPKMLNMLNLAGFGLRAWDPGSHQPENPFFYGSPSLPVFDRNLKNLAEKVRAGCVLAHVRGVAYSAAVEISLQNVHPFQFDGVPWALAHNGDLAGMEALKPRLAPHIQPRFLAGIRGTTDSEWIYALFMSQLSDPRAAAAEDQAFRALSRTLEILREARADAGVSVVLRREPLHRQRPAARRAALLLRLRPLRSDGVKRERGARARSEPQLPVALVHARSKLRAARRRMEDDRRRRAAPSPSRRLRAAHARYFVLGGASGVRRPVRGDQERPPLRLRKASRLAVPAEKSGSEPYFLSYACRK